MSKHFSPWAAAILWGMGVVPFVLSDVGADDKRPEFAQATEIVDPRVHFNEAREKFLDKDTKSSGAAIRKGVVAMDMMANRLPASEANALRRAAANADHFSYRVGRGEVQSIYEYDDAMASVLSVLDVEISPKIN